MPTTDPTVAALAEPLELRSNMVLGNRARIGRLGRAGHR